MFCDNKESLTTVTIGARAETTARKFLENNHLTFVARNYTVKGGEIDLIMRDQQYLVFIEVKLRSNPSHGQPIELVPKAKQARIIHAAKLYLLKQQIYYTERCRFDVIGISEAKNQSQQQKISWIKDAFRVQ